MVIYLIHETFSMTKIEMQVGISIIKSFSSSLSNQLIQFLSLIKGLLWGNNSSDLNRCYCTTEWVIIPNLNSRDKHTKKLNSLDMIFSCTDYFDCHILTYMKILLEVKMWPLIGVDNSMASTVDGPSTCLPILEAMSVAPVVDAWFLYLSSRAWRACCAGPCDVWAEGSIESQTPSFTYVALQRELGWTTNEWRDSCSPSSRLSRGRGCNQKTNTAIHCPHCVN